MSPEIDKGMVYIQDTIEFDKSISNLTQSCQFISSREAELFSNFLKGDCKPLDQLDGGSYYWPKLSTEVNGYINWSWSAKEIVAFCNAFVKPFDGEKSINIRAGLRFVTPPDVLFSALTTQV